MQKKLKSGIAIALMLTSAMVFGGCSATESEKAPQTLTEASVQEKSVFRPTFDTKDGVYTAGTAVGVRVEGVEGTVILTAGHLFGPSGGMEREIATTELPEFLKKATFNDLFTDELVFECDTIVSMPEISELPEITNDLAVLLANKDTKIPTYEIDDSPLSEGDTVWLLASISGGGEDEMKLHKAKVMASDNTALVIEYDSTELDLTASSGAPILNGSGKVVGINLGSMEEGGKLVGIANPAMSFKPIITKALAK